MPFSALDVVRSAFQRMKRLLFLPVRPGQWLRFALVGFLAGEMGGSGGCSSLRIPFNFPDSQPREQFQVGIPGAPGVLFFLGIALALFLILVLVIVFTYINSRMRFVLFDSIVDGECRIRDSWSRRGTPAFRYFLFQIAVALAAFASFGVLIGVPALLGFGMGLFENPRQHILALVLGGLIVGFLFLTWLIAFILLQVLTKDFIVPQMALDDVTATEAWRRLWNMMSAEKVGYAGYLGMKAALSLAAGIVLGIVTLLVVLVILIPVGGLSNHSAWRKSGRTRMEPPHNCHCDRGRSHRGSRTDPDYVFDFSTGDRLFPGVFNLFLRRALSTSAHAAPIQVRLRHRSSLLLNSPFPQP